MGSLSNVPADLEFSPDGELLAVRGRSENTGRRIVWDLHAQKQTWSLNSATLAKNGRPIPVDWNLSLKVAAIGRENKAVELVDLATGHTQHTLRGHREPIDVVLVDRDGKSAISAASSETARVWDIRTGQERSQVAVDGRLVGLAVKRNGTPVVTVHKNPNSFLNEDIPIGAAPGVTNEFAEMIARGWLGTSVRSTSGYGYIHEDAVTRDGKKGAVCMGIGPCLGGAVFIESGKESQLLIAGEIPGYPVLRFSPDSRWLVAAASGNAPSEQSDTSAESESMWIGVWDANTGKPLFRVMPDDGVGEFSFSPDGASLAVVGSKRIYVWRNFAKDAAAASK